MQAQSCSLSFWRILSRIKYSNVHDPQEQSGTAGKVGGTLGTTKPTDGKVLVAEHVDSIQPSFRWPVWRARPPSNLCASPARMAGLVRLDGDMINIPRSIDSQNVSPKDRTVSLSRRRRIRYRLTPSLLDPPTAINCALNLETKFVYANMLGRILLP